jgi:hypothetical protein
MPRPKILSSTPAQSETIVTATTITFKIALNEQADRVGEIISTERVGDKLVVKAKVRLENPMQPSGNWVVSFE